MLSRGEELLLTILGLQFPHYTIIPQKTIKVGYKSLYLDYYIPQLKMAFEFDGQQHFQFISFFHKTLKGFQNSLKRDSMKDKYCRENGITLVHIPDNGKLTLEKVRNIISKIPIYESE